MTTLSSGSLPLFLLFDPGDYIHSSATQDHQLITSSDQQNYLGPKILQSSLVRKKDVSVSLEMNNRKKNIKRRPPIPRSHPPIYSHNLHCSLEHCRSLSKTERFCSIRIQPKSLPCPSKYASQENFNLSKFPFDSPKNDTLSQDQRLFPLSNPIHTMCENKLNIQKNLVDKDVHTHFPRKFQTHSNEQFLPGSNQKIPSDTKFYHSLNIDKNNLSTPLTLLDSMQRQDSSSFRKFIPSIKFHSRHRFLSTQSSDQPSNQFSNLSADLCYSPDRPNECLHETIPNEVKLKTSHSADNNLHSYSNFSEFINPRSFELEDTPTEHSFSDCLNIEFTFKHNYRVRSSEKRALFNCNSASSVERAKVYDFSNTIKNSVDYQNSFVPIIRSESTPCICSPTLRIGIKRRNREMERPTADFSKMYHSQFYPIISTPSISPIEESKRFSSRSPESIPDDWSYESNFELKEISDCERSRHYNIRCGAEKLDLQSIEEN